jgi:uncharacterized protein (DUF1330 family)
LQLALRETAALSRTPTTSLSKEKKSMSAYVIVDIDVTDPQGYQEYIKLAPPTITAYGGKYIARGGKTEVLEGEWAPKRLVILEFENLERAKAWLESPEYHTPRQMRHRTATTNMVVIEGVG